MFKKFCKIPRSKLLIIFCLGLIIFMFLISVLYVRFNKSSLEDVKSYEGSINVTEESNVSTNDVFHKFETTDTSNCLVSDSLFESYDVTIVDYWATYCPYCKEEMPLLEAYKDTLDKNVNLIGAVSLIDRDEDGKRTERDDSNTIKAAIEDIEDTGITYQNIIANDSFKEWMGYEIRLFPTIFLIDKNGEIIENSFIDGFNKDEINSMLNEYLSTGKIKNIHYSDNFMQMLEDQPLPYDVGDEITLRDGTTISIQTNSKGELVGIPKELLNDFYTHQFNDSAEDFVIYIDSIKRDIPKR